MVLRYSPKRPNWGRGLTLCPLPSGAAWPEETSALGLQTKKFLDPSGSDSLLRWRSAWGSQVGRPTVCSSCEQSGKKYLEFAFEIPQKLKLLPLGSSILWVFWKAQLWPLAGLLSSVTLFCPDQHQLPKEMFHRRYISAGSGDRAGSPFFSRSF